MSQDASVREIRLAQISDLHIGAVSDVVVAELVDDVARMRPDATVVCGDLTMRARSGQFRRAAAMLDALPQPVLVVPGNHDIPLFNLPQRLVAPYSGYRAGITPTLDPVLDLPGVRILGLNTMPRWRWKAGRATPGQCSRVEAVFEGVPADIARVVVTHHPVLPGDLSAMLGRSRLIASCARARVDVLLSGHTHEPLLAPVWLTDGARGSAALSSVSGTAVSTRVRGASNSYAVLTLSPTRVRGEIRSWTGSGFHTALTAESHRGGPRAERLLPP